MQHYFLVEFYEKGTGFYETREYKTKEEALYFIKYLRTQNDVGKVSLLEAKEIYIDE